jgi:diguanylate cyclase (GGDEF)-like protein
MSERQKTGKKYCSTDAALLTAERILADPTAAGIDLAAEYRALAESYRKLDHKLYKTLIISDSYQLESKQLTSTLAETLHSFQKLKDVALPICMVCHKIHTNNDYWEQLEEYFSKHADVLFSHGICPDCIKVTYGKLGEQVLAQQKAAKEQKNPEKTHEPPEDNAVTEMRALVERAATDKNPLTEEIEKVVKKHTKLLRRFDKIVSLSDSYQSQLREFNLRLELMAHTDPLTGINNRGFFMELLGIELDRAKRYGRVFSILMLDLDHFKVVNDTRGHAAGDEALRALCTVLQESGLRKSDFIGRIGGEEFALALPETDIHAAAETAERIRLNLAQAAVTHDDRIFFITASFGISEYRSDDTRETMLNRADKAMYRAKETGRNRVCCET